MRSLLILISSCCLSLGAFAQPDPCGVDEMTSTCLDACVVCDIDGFTGRNDLTIQGQTFGEFCTTIFHNMSYIAFIAGTEDLVIDVAVTNCTTNNGVEIGIFESLDCSTFTPVTECNTDVQPNGTARFSNTVPLVIGQHYYLVMDGSRGDICDWTFNVVSGNTQVGALSSSGIIQGPENWCPGLTSTYSVPTQTGATFFDWSIDGVAQNSQTAEIDVTFPADGTYELCVRASNVCDEAPPTCATIQVATPTSISADTICANECVTVAGETVCETGLHQFSIPLQNGCDSIVILNLIVLPDLGETLDLSICEGDSFFIGNTSYNSSGTYVETISNVNGCDSIVTLNLTVLDCELVATISHDRPTCNGDLDASISISLDNGIPPFAYEWKDIRNITVNGSGTSATLDDLFIDNLASGTYEIKVFDSLGDVVVFIEEIVDPPVFTLSVEAVDRNGFNLSCFNSTDGEATAITSGGVQPYTFLWSNYATQASISALDAGTYLVDVVDANGCERQDEVTLVAPEPINALVNFIDPDCEGEETGIIQLVSIQGGAEPYTYALEGGGFGANSNFENLGSGTHVFQVLDANGCSVDTSSVLFAPDIPVIYLDDTSPIIDLGSDLLLSALTNNSSLIDIQWEGPANSLSCDTCLETFAAPINDSEYSLTITSIDNCMDTKSIFIRVNKNIEIFVPTAFSPNGDGVNDNLTVFASNAVSSILNFNVFNRWGDVVYSGVNLVPNETGSGWDGGFNGKMLNDDVFVWTAEVEYLDGEVYVMKGDVSIVK